MRLLNYFLFLVLFFFFASAETFDIDNLIVGSGFGGSVAAHRLTQAGQQVLMLERGDWYQINNEGNTFSTYRQPDGRSAWFRDRVVAPGYNNLPNSEISARPGIFEYWSPEPNPLDPGFKRTGTGQLFWAGAAVGGGSVVYNGILLKPTKSHFNRAFNNPELYNNLYEELEEFYQTARGILNPFLIPDQILNTPEYLNARIFRDQAVNAGFPEGSFSDEFSYGTTKIPFGVSWDIVRQELDGSRVASLINGNLWYGVNSGAKFSTDQPGNYLDRALRTGRLEIRPLHNVIQISFDSSSRRYIVLAQKLSSSSREVLGTDEFRVKNLFLAAGSLGTSALLTRAKGRADLRDLPLEIGTQFGCNGDSFVVRFANSNGESTNADAGAPGAFAVYAHNATSSPIVFFNMPVVWGPLVGLNNLIVQIGMGIPTNPGAGLWFYNRENDTVSYNWPSGVADRNVWEALVETINKVNNGNPGSFGGTETLEELMFGSMHPLGGVPLGRATDMFGRVRNYRGLYVVDASLIPGSTGAVNPALTTVALAERCMREILRTDYGVSVSELSSESYGSILSPSIIIQLITLLSITLLF